MSNAAERSLRAGPGESNDDVFPLRERLRFRNNLGLGLRDVRGRPAFRALARGPWQVFIAIACHWQANAEAWPSQETIASFTGYSSRAVRDYVAALEAAAIVRLRRERRADGGERIFYAPGAVTLTEVAAFVDRFPPTAAPAKAIASHQPEAGSGPPAEMAAAPLPEASSMEHRDQDQERSSCASAPVGKRPKPHDEEEQRFVTSEDRAIARVALGERMKRKSPRLAPPRWFDRRDVEMVALCTAAIEGDRDARALAHRDAIAGAFLASKDGPPTARFVWGSLAYFCEHRARGRYARELEEARRQAAAPRRAGPDAEARIAPEEMRADLERLFGRIA